MSATTGFAVVVDGKIDLRTVSETASAAKVNGLLVLFRRMALRDASESEIDTAWTSLADPARHAVKPVSIKLVTHEHGGHA